MKPFASGVMIRCFHLYCLETNSLHTTILAFMSGIYPLIAPCQVLIQRIPDSIDALN